MSNVLEVEGLSASYGRNEVISDIDIHVANAGITALLGANGAGKTTTLRAISNVLVNRKGSIRITGRQASSMKAEAIVRLGVGHVPDGRGTFIDFTVEENLQAGAYTRPDRRGIAGDIERVCSYFPRLKERFHQQAGTLSGGEQQMLAISRALMLRPRLLLLDEPSFGLAPLVVREIFGILSRISREEEIGILLVEQNANLALKIADHALPFQRAAAGVNRHPLPAPAA